MSEFRTIGGEWIDDPSPVHKCLTPPSDQIQKVENGKRWKCDCGKTWAVSYFFDQREMNAGYKYWRQL